jgi:hypothetical protein
MAFSYQSAVDLARIPLNDGDQTRYSDSILLSFANQGVLHLLRRRPDLSVGSFDTLPDGNAALADAFPLPPEYLQTVADYVTARAETADDEHANSGRAALFAGLFSAETQP